MKLSKKEKQNLITIYYNIILFIICIISLGYAIKNEIFLVGYFSLISITILYLYTIWACYYH